MLLHRYRIKKSAYNHVVNALLHDYKQFTEHKRVRSLLLDYALRKVTVVSLLMLKGAPRRRAPLPVATGDNGPIRKDESNSTVKCGER